MTTALATFPSNSNPGKTYTIFEANDGTTIYCDCMQWKMKKTCRHLTAYQASMNTAVQAAQTHKQMFASIDEIIAREAARLANEA
jgi:hypothetical protein